MNAKIARPHKVEPGKNKSASKIPNWAEEIVAPVVGETNLFMHSCCIISPATLIPTPVQSMASSRGSREIKNISNSSKSPVNSADSLISITPTKSERMDKSIRLTNNIVVNSFPLIVIPPL